MDTASTSALNAVHRGQQQFRAQAAQTDRREQALDRVDQLVRGMEAVARRLSSDQVSSTQRSVLISRFNDMQRRVNEIDGVVGSEGRGEAVGSIGAGQSFSVETPQAAEQAFRQISQATESERRPAPEPARTPVPARPVQEAGRPSSEGNIVDLQA